MLNIESAGILIRELGKKTKGSWRGMWGRVVDDIYGGARPS
jgi:hypothetical protein